VIFFTEKRQQEGRRAVTKSRSTNTWRTDRAMAERTAACKPAEDVGGEHALEPAQRAGVVRDCGFANTEAARRR
jgi:hypothetical protein